MVIARQTRAIDPTFVDNGVEKEPFCFRQSPITAREYVPFELADFIAYATQRTACIEYTPNGKRFRKLIDIISPQLVHVVIALDGGLGFQVPNLRLSIPNAPSLHY